jgi:uncharacterized alkaline shock family protein YloU
MTENTPVPDSSKGAATDVHVDASGSGTTAVRGTVRIAPAVLIELVELTIRGIEGVAGLRSHAAEKGDVPDGARMFDNGKIAVTVSGDQISVAVGCAIARGTNVSELSAQCQQAIGFAVGNMLGMTVRAVDIHIQEIVADPTTS